ncbi:MAG: AAA family ATPase [Phycisphaerae bacterium]|nr:AAA family ATPase [Phycisphaerae bacterium]
MIHSIEIRGYRLLESFKADLNQLTVVIGANATGKSTLLDCFQMIAQCAEFPLGQVVDWHGGMFSIPNASSNAGEFGWKLVIGKPEHHPFAAGAPLAPEREYVYEVVVGQVPGQPWQPMGVREVFRTAEPGKGDTEPLKYLDAVGNRCRVFDRRQNCLVPFDDALPETENSIQSGGSGEHNSPSTVWNVPPPSQGSGLRLAQMRFFNEYPELSWFRVLLSNVHIYPGFEVGKGSALRTKSSDIRFVTALDATGENLGMVLHELLTRHDFHARADTLRDFLRSAYPSFEAINAETAPGAAGKVLIRLRETGFKRPMELWELSDGVLRFLCLAAALLNPLPPVLVMIDEPETGLHPRLLPIVGDMIKTASEQTQVLVTTHSPDLLNCFSLDDVVVMTRDESRAEWRRPGDRKSLHKMLEAVTGETLGDLHRSGELEAY